MIKLREQILKEIKKEGLKYANFNQLFLFLSGKLNQNAGDISKCVNKMMKEGVLVEDSKRKLQIASDFGYKKGVILGNSRGFAFIKPITSGRMLKGESDYFVPANKLLGALDGDEVLFKEEKDKTASIKKILKRKNTFLVGKLVGGLDLGVKYKRILVNEFYAVPDNDKFSKPILINKKELKNAKEGDRVKVELTFQPEGTQCGLPVGRIKKILSDDDIENGIESIMCEYQIPDEFPDKVIKEADKFVTDFEKEKKKRIDLSEKTIITIDGADAKDLDDAVSIEKITNGYILGVHIADVGEYVRRGSEVDKEAFIRGTSVYFPDRVSPMLPQKLSNNLCSLNPKEEKLALSVEMTLNSSGTVQSYKIFESVIKSSARLTYDQVFEVIKNGKKQNFIKDSKVINSILLLHELSMKVGDIRQSEGALDFDIPETQFEMDGTKIIDVKKRDRNTAHKLIENFMILCNQTVAQHFSKLGISFVYRVHEKPARARINEVIEVLKSFGLNIRLTGDITSKFIQTLLNSLEGKEYNEVANKIILRALEKALYLEDCLGHFGLALQYYCHFTSPIRRYPDLTIHRIIKKVCRCSPNNIITEKEINFAKVRNIFKKDYDLEEFVIDSAFQSSERERKADEAERSADDLFKAKFMQDKIGQVFEAKICGVNNFGVFVELPNTIEGLIKIENLPEDDYKYDEKRLVLKGRRRKFSIGDKLKVVLSNVNLTIRKIEFLISEN